MRADGKAMGEVYAARRAACKKVLVPVIGWSLVLTAIAAFFAPDAVRSAVVAFGNSMGWLSTILVIPYMLAFWYGAAWGFTPGVTLMFTLMLIGLVSFLQAASTAVPREHTHGDYAHSHKHNGAHHHDNRHPDRVYYR